MFHSPGGDVEAQFMHKSGARNYFWGEDFAAVGLGFENGAEMWLMLPDEGVSAEELVESGAVEKNPIRHAVAAVSAGIVGDVPMLDLCYEEDSRAMVDLNCVMNDAGELIEIQGTGEGRGFTVAEQQELVRLCEKGIRELLEKQRACLE